MLLQRFDPLPGRLKLSLQSGNKIDQPTSVDLARFDILSELLKAFQPMVDRYPFVGHVRGKGLMIAIELVSDKKTKAPLDKKTCEWIYLRCLHKGLLSMTYAPRVRVPTIGRRCGGPVSPGRRGLDMSIVRTRIARFGVAGVIVAGAAVMPVSAFATCDNYGGGSCGSATSAPTPTTAISNRTSDNGGLPFTGGGPRVGSEPSAH